MASSYKVKVALLAGFSVLVTIWAISGSFSPAMGVSVSEEMAAAAPAISGNADDYVGSEACLACHEDQSKHFAMTKHAKLKDVPAWKDKVLGCEACHGPGKAHIEENDPKKIISFKDKNSKEISETCLTCHSGKEAHNNFRRGEHWRNDVGCTDCHSSHSAPENNFRPDSVVFVGDVSRQNPGRAPNAMLRQPEPQLCMSCHTETRAQFSKPFHHKVLEGAMNCTSCHNAHGGFESKQAKLGVGADTSCVKCHTNKQGPFVFEHAPLKTEGCAACHAPHGSANPKMLNRGNIRQLCLECHSNITEQLAPGLPSFHNQLNVRYKECTTCHTTIHGSNSNRFFFR